MWQVIIAVVLIGFFLSRLFWQKRRGRLSKSEFIFWLIFWLAALALMLSLKWLDALVARLGFSGSGIQVLLYLAVACLFYFIFRLRLRLVKMDQDISRLVEHLALKREDKNKQ